eukprot:1145558-Pelagomonas_calceolata.AAC.2
MDDSRYQHCHRKKRKRKTTLAEETLLTSVKEKETHWLSRAVTPLHPKAAKQKMLMWIWIWRDTGSIRLQDQVVRSIVVFNSMPSGNKLVGVHNRMGMQFASTFIGTLLVKSQHCHNMDSMLGANVFLFGPWPFFYVPPQRKVLSTVIKT